jgi:hypothetical protein
MARTTRRPRTWAVTLLGLLALGCGANATIAPPIPPADAPPESVTVYVDRALAAPYRLEQLIVALDRTLLFLKLDEEAGPWMRDLGTHRVAPGDHQLWVTAVVSLPCGWMDGPRMHVMLRRMRNFTAGNRPVAASVVIDDLRESPIFPFAERLDLRFVVAGERELLDNAEEPGLLDNLSTQVKVECPPTDADDAR